MKDRAYIVSHSKELVFRNHMQGGGVDMIKSHHTDEVPALVWFRQDLRLKDNPALFYAAQKGGALLPVFIQEQNTDSWAWGGASRWWLHRSLKALEMSLQRRGLPLVLDRGEPKDVLARLVQETGARIVHWNRRHEPRAVAQDQAVRLSLESLGVQVKEHLSGLLVEPTALTTGKGGPYQVFTPYWKKFLQTVKVDDPLPVPTFLTMPARIPKRVKLVDLGLQPSQPWDAGLKKNWQPGEYGAQLCWKNFHKSTLSSYDALRDLVARPGTSCLSPHLHWGEISPRQVWDEAQRESAAGPYLRQIVWREFAHHLLHHYPHMPESPLRNQFRSFPWDGDPALLGAWQRGKTGYPLVDAGMRQLWHTGWMHNRVRMVAASFLVKHLLLPWQEGARWFWDTLVDANLANNTFGWQWTAGCGADAAPYFRVFNPVAQGKRFDKQGEYIRRWVPELSALPDKLIHEPWGVESSVLAHLGIRLGRNYPHPVVDHATARQRALDSYQRMKSEA